MTSPESWHNPIRRWGRRAAVTAGGAALATTAGCSAAPDQTPKPSTSISTTAEATPTHAPFDPSKMRILFASNMNGENYDIYMRDEKGHITDLTPNTPTNEMNPSPSPDGTSIVYYSDRGKKGNNVIVKQSIAKPFSPVILADNAASNYDPFYLDKDRIIYKSNTDDGYGDIWKMNADGTRQYNLTPDMSSTEEWKATVSPDGKIMIITSREDTSDSKDAAKSDQLYRYNIVNNPDGTIRLADETLLTDSAEERNVSDWYPAMAPKGDELAYVSKRKQGENDGIYLRNVHGGKPTHVPIDSSYGDCSDPSWTPDGEHILVVCNGSGSYEIMAIDPHNPEKPTSVIKHADSDELSPVVLPTEQH